MLNSNTIRFKGHTRVLGEMSEMPELPKPGSDAAGEVVAPGVPSYRANLPANLGDLSDEREALVNDVAVNERTANVFMTLGLLSGIGAFIFPFFAGFGKFSGLASLTGAVNSFVGTVFICVLIGVVFGAIAASIRSRSKVMRSRIRALDEHERALKRQLDSEGNRE